MINKNEWHEVEETSRTYTFPGGETLKFFDVQRVRVSNSHTHFLESLRGIKHIVRNTWLALEIDGKWLNP